MSKSSSRNTNKISNNIDNMIKNDKWNRTGNKFSGQSVEEDAKTISWWLAIIIGVVFFVLILLEYLQLDNEVENDKYNAKRPEFAYLARTLIFINMGLYVVSTYLTFQEGKLTEQMKNQNVFFFMYYLLYISVQYLFAYNFIKGFGTSDDSDKRFRPAGLALILWIFLSGISCIRAWLFYSYTLAFFRLLEFLLVLTEFIFLLFFDDVHAVPFEK
jgi:hypothetical protein